MTTTFEIGKTYQHPYNDCGFKVTARTPCFVTVECNGVVEKKKVRGKDCERFEIWNGTACVYADKPYISHAEREAIRQKAIKEAEERARAERKAVPIEEGFRKDAPEIAPETAIHWILTNDIKRMVENARSIRNGGAMICANPENNCRDFHVNVGGYEVCIKETRKDRGVIYFSGHGISASTVNYEIGGKFVLETYYPQYDGRYMDEDGVFREKDGSKFEFATPY